MDDVKRPKKLSPVVLAVVAGAVAGGVVIVGLGVWRLGGAAVDKAKEVREDAKMAAEPVLEIEDLQSELEKNIPGIEYIRYENDSWQATEPKTKDVPNLRGVVRITKYNTYPTKKHKNGFYWKNFDIYYFSDNADCERFLSKIKNALSVN